MNDILKDACNEAKKLALIAAEEIMNIYDKDFDVEYKEDDSPVTIADKLSNRIISEGLKQKFPQFAILAEESEDDLSRLDNDYCFIVDPLDGTKEFVKKNGEFCINIALSYKGESVMGVVYIPVKKKMYWAITGMGAYSQVEGEEPCRICPSNKTEKLTIAVSRSHFSKQEQDLIENHDIKNVLQHGSTIKGCLVADGTAEIYYRFDAKTMQWDTAAMQIIVEEAGGIFRQMDGSPMLYNRKELVNVKGFYAVNRKENIFVGTR
jgi:3'(2'), 5'-bisphosphate nucleotidase